MSSPVESKADTIAHLRRRMAEIPARTGGPTRPSSAAFAPTRIDADAKHAAPSALRVLPAPDPIARLLPHRGLVRGSTVHISGATALRVGLVASVTGAGNWVAVIGSPNFGLLAATEMGADLARCALVPDPGPDPIAVAAVLLDGIDLVVLSLGGANVPPSRARAVTARVRSSGAVLVVTDGSWPTVDLHLNAQVAGYRGIDTARGRVTGFDVAVHARMPGRQPHRGVVTLTGHSGGVTWGSDPAVPTGLKVAQ